MTRQLKWSTTIMTQKGRHYKSSSTEAEERHLYNF